MEFASTHNEWDKGHSSHCGIVSNTENNSFTMIVYVRTYLETFKQTLKTHNGTREGVGVATLAKKKKKKKPFHSQNTDKKMDRKMSN